MKKTLIKVACTMKSLYKIKNEIKANIINLYPKSNRYINLGSGHTRYLGWTNCVKNIFQSVPVIVIF